MGAKLDNMPVSKYKTVIAAARRALELSGGAHPLLKADPKRKPAVVAIQEMIEGKVGFRVKKPEKE